MNSRQTTYQMYLSHTTAQNNETNECYKIWRNKRPKRSRSKKLLLKKDQKWWSGMSSNAKQKASSQFLSHVCSYQHCWRESEKTSTGKKKPPKSQYLSWWYQQVRYKKVCTPQGRELKSKQRKKERKKTKRECNLENLYREEFRKTPADSLTTGDENAIHNLEPGNWRESESPGNGKEGRKGKRGSEATERGQRTETRERRETVQNNKSNAANFFTLGGTSYWLRGLRGVPHHFTIQEQISALHPDK
jgi:hypothetical protein